MIGGSIGLAIKRRRVAKEVVGVFRHASTLKRALKKKAIDKGVMSIAEGVSGADLIIVASPVCYIPLLIKEAVRYAEPGAIITDAGSTKGWIVDEVEKIMKRQRKIFFVGAHPMAGSERAGVEFAKHDLLEGAPCIVTKTGRTNKKALNKTISFWRSLGAKVSVMSPEAHDKSVSLVSHLPHIVAFSLAGAVPLKELSCAAEGFKDTTRVASSDPRLWTDIFLTNKKEILRAGKLFEKYYKYIMNSVSRGDYSGTVSALAKAKTKRDRFVYDKERA